MEKLFYFQDYKVKVNYEPGIIRVCSDNELWQFLDGQASVRLEILSQAIKTQYQQIYNKALQIETDSLIVELVAHIYCDYIGLAFNKIVPIRYTQRIVGKLLKRAEIIDCGEKGHDSNRWLWDLLSAYKRTIVMVLPKNLHAKKLKPASPVGDYNS
ncbi:hypothetical protein [Pedobacter sandarakinus]|uniref:hypothetical protein n=1 Tax=Pedobacter sandarakinus TaxID=353156 RepID=UPI002246DF03|nr:hypothetical protein [Pedobacter sandarakinus]MCX2574383.1 hypothetical protein [Pedobacter sandarakinus]